MTGEAEGKLVEGLKKVQHSATLGLRTVADRALRTLKAYDGMSEDVVLSLGADGFSAVGDASALIATSRSSQHVFDGSDTTRHDHDDYGSASPHLASVDFTPPAPKHLSATDAEKEEHRQIALQQQEPGSHCNIHSAPLSAHMVVPAVTFDAVKDDGLATAVLPLPDSKDPIPVFSQDAVSTLLEATASPAHLDPLSSASKMRKTCSPSLASSLCSAPSDSPILLTAPPATDLSQSLVSPGSLSSPLHTLHHPPVPPPQSIPPPPPPLSPKPPSTRPPPPPPALEQQRVENVHSPAT